MLMRSMCVAAMLLGLAALAPAQVARPAGDKKAETVTIDTSVGDAMVAAYFKAESAKLAAQAPPATLEAWKAQREARRGELLDMLGLNPMPPRTDLKATVTGVHDGGTFTVENLHYQSRPGLYVTANLYVPKNLKAPAPAVLYVCGHASGKSKATGINAGGKSHYQHHGIWFANHGYVCMVIDTIQLGELEGIHHGTHNKGMWWWLSRGYTPAGVEAWNGVRAIDYLQSRKEVDGSRIGVTGRSGGGGYSWWISSIDERVTAAVPVAGITDVTNHVVDGTIEGHCDCMFMVNTYRWDYWQVAAMLAPRPVLIANTDKDRIFPLDGVERLHWNVRKVYDLYDVPRQLGLNITEGPHKDTQELQVHAFVWMNRWVRKDESPIESLAVRRFEPRDLKVLDAPPADEITTKIHETFVPVADWNRVPESREAWRRQTQGWMAGLRERTFRGWPQESSPTALRRVKTMDRHGLRLSVFEYEPQPTVELDLYLVHRAELTKPELTVLHVLDEAGWGEFTGWMGHGFPEALGGAAVKRAPDREAFASLRQKLTGTTWAMAYVAPRGVGPTMWTRDVKEATHIERRFAMLGQTSDGMRVWDVRRAMQGLRSLPELKGSDLWMQSQGSMAGVALYASLFEPAAARLDLRGLPATHREGPILLNVLRVLDAPAAVAMAAERSHVRLYGAAADWSYVKQVSAKLGWDAERVQVMGAAR